MRSTLERIHELGGDAVTAQHAFLEHCGVITKDINDRPSGVIVIGWNKYRWIPLERDAQGPLGIARTATDAFVELASGVVNFSAPDRSSQLEKALTPLQRVLEQSQGSSGAPGVSIDLIRNAVENAVADGIAVVENIPAANYSGGRILVPDTNALVHEPDISKWDNGDRRTLVITPFITQELDELKMRNGDVGKKATKVINQLNEFERRGDTFKGIKVAGALTLKEIAIQAKFEFVPTWLELGRNDDQIIASALELGLADLNSQVAIVTRDRNMRNRARMAGLEVVSAEEISRSTS